LTETKEIRKFGTIAFIFFGLLSALALWRQHEAIIYLFGLLSTFGLLLLMFPKGLQPIYNGWLKIARFIGKISTIIVLTLAYYIVITPFGLIKRAVSGPPIPTSPDKSMTSYWVSRAEPTQPKERFIKRY
jgi:hypothetical protein